MNWSNGEQSFWRTEKLLEEEREEEPEEEQLKLALLLLLLLVLLDAWRVQDETSSKVMKSKVDDLLVDKIHISGENYYLF